jgi:hypothetical protein
MDYGCCKRWCPWQPLQHGVASPRISFRQWNYREDWYWSCDMNGQGYPNPTEAWENWLERESLKRYFNHNSPFTEIFTPTHEVLKTSICLLLHWQGCLFVLLQWPIWWQSAIIFHLMSTLKVNSVSHTTNSNGNSLHLMDVFRTNILLNGGHMPDQYFNDQQKSHFHRSKMLAWSHITWSFHRWYRKLYFIESLCVTDHDDSIRDSKVLFRLLQR